MPAAPRRREPRVRRRLPPRPTYHEAPVEMGPAAVAHAPDEARLQRAARERAMLAAQRESRYLTAELKRVAGVTATCVGMLVVLAILQRVTS